MRHTSRLLTLAGRIYSLLLYAYPTAFRREFGFDMAQAFRDDTHDTLHESGTVGLIGLWFLTFTDLLNTALSEHIWEVFHMRTDRLQRFSGTAAAIGGPLWASSIIWAFVLDPQVSREVLERVLLAGWLLSGALMAVGLAGLYRRLRASALPINALTFGAALLGLVLHNTASLVLLLIPRWEEITFPAAGVGFIAFVLGMTRIGLVTISRKALGRWSFLPLAIVASGILMAMATTVFVVNNVDDSNFTALASLSLYGMSWLLLGIALWSTRAETLVRQQPV
jgi:hypothetical protein